MAYKDRINRSHFTQKQAEKDLNQSPEEMKLRKLEDIVQKLHQACQKDSNPEKSHQDQNKASTTNKSNFSSPTSTRMKEDRSDREFLSNFVYMEDKNQIAPQKMHLLTDNDTNQNISMREKFQNLSNLMVDDKNITEFNFIRNSEDRVKLYLYSAFSKKSKEIFLNEKHPKQSKNQLLFHKINDIHIPKFEFSPPSEESHSSFNEDSNNNNEEEKIKNEEDKKFEEKYFRQKEKGYFHIPTLIKVSTGKQNNKKLELKKSNTSFFPVKMLNRLDERKDEIFWDPEIDSDTLTSINHNFICIEDIYNSDKNEQNENKNKSEKKNNEELEPNLVPIIAKEIQLDEGLNNTKKMLVKSNKKLANNENKPINKFIEFIAINVGVVKQEYQVASTNKSQEKFEIQLKNDFNELINKYIEVDKGEFPIGKDLTPKKIERFLRFKMLRQISKQIDFTIKSTEQSENNNNNNKLNEENKNTSKDKINNSNEENLIFIDNSSGYEIENSFPSNFEKNNGKELKLSHDQEDNNNKT